MSSDAGDVTRKQFSKELEGEALRPPKCLAVGTLSTCPVQ